jgi:hypothetical protein
MAAMLVLSIIEFAVQGGTASVVTVLDYRCRGPGFDSRALQKKVVCLERGALCLVSRTEELLDEKVAAPV